MSIEKITEQPSPYRHLEKMPVAELLEHGAQIVVLSKGVQERLQTCPETLEMLEAQGIRVYVLQTEIAIERYNLLAQSEAVGALIHSTC